MPVMTLMPKSRGSDILAEYISIFAEITALAFPVAFVFAFGSKLVHSFLSMAFDGWFKL